MTNMNQEPSPLSAKWFARSAADEVPAGGGGAKTAALVTMGRYFLILLIASLFPPTFLAYSLSPSRSLSLALSSLAQFLFATSPAARKFLILRTAHLSLVATSLLRGTIQLQFTTFS